MMVHEALCTQKEFDDLCRTFDEQNVDAFIFLTPTDVMFSAACRARISRPRVLITSAHGGMGVQEELRLLRPADRRKVALVGIDQWGAMEDVMHVLKARGHRSALYFAGPREWRDAFTRLAAWNKLCATNAVNSVTVQCKTWEGGEAYAKMNHVLENIGRSGGRLPSAVVTANDAQAMGVARAMHEHGVRIPQDVSLVGFDDMPGVDNMLPPLTTVRQDFEALGQLAMCEVLYLLGEGAEPGYASSQHGVGLVPAKLVQRSSVGGAVDRLVRPYAFLYGCRRAKRLTQTSGVNMAECEPEVSSSCTRLSHAAVASISRLVSLSGCRLLSHKPTDVFLVVCEDF